MSGDRTARTASTREALINSDGSIILELGEDGMVDLIARTTPAGKPVFVCVPHSEAVKALAGPVSSPKATAEEK
jgi:hypothetical protein